ncbi:MAG: Tim44/TimA family putative adaptor protein [Alphaproteobacteria bacterium]
MGEGLQFLDIILFAMVAVFLVLRLRSVLGRKPEGEQQRRPNPFRREPADDKAAASDRLVEFPARPPHSAPAALVGGISALEAGLAEIKRVDPSFDSTTFVTGATAAFEIVVKAFAAGDRDKLRTLLSNDVYENFAGAIDARLSKGESLESKLSGATTAQIVEAEMRGQSAFVTVKFTSEQSNVTRDREGRIVDGEPNNFEEVTDLWSFARNTRARDPNWTLVETRIPQS